MMSWFPKTEVLRVPLDAFDPGVVSFTYPDSMISLVCSEWERFRPYLKPWHGEVYTLEEIYKVVREYGFPEAWDGDGKNFDRYVEVQVWTDECLKI